MIRKSIALFSLPVALSVFGGCDVPEESTEAQSSNLTNQNHPFVNVYKRSAQRTTVWNNNQPYEGWWYLCGSNEVVVGVHFDSGLVSCATLNAGVTATDPIIDFSRGSQVPWDNNPRAAYMHGCPKNRWVQGIRSFGFTDEDLLCVNVRNNGVVQQATHQYVDGYGSSNNGTQSSIYGLGSPNMHVCGNNVMGQNEGVYGMAGVHQAWNDLFCAN